LFVPPNVSASSSSGLNNAHVSIDKHPHPIQLDKSSRIFVKRVIRDSNSLSHDRDNCSQSLRFGALPVGKPASASPIESSEIPARWAALITATRRTTDRWNRRWFPADRYAVYESPEVREATTNFDHETNQLISTVILEPNIPDSILEELKTRAANAVAETVGSSFLNSIEIVIILSNSTSLGGLD
jgi:hypothetical protein